jgi:hypothetical protein
MMRLATPGLRNLIGSGEPWKRAIRRQVRWTVSVRPNSEFPIANSPAGTSATAYPMERTSRVVERISRVVKDPRPDSGPSATRAALRTVSVMAASSVSLTEIEPRNERADRHPATEPDRIPYPGRGLPVTHVTVTTVRVSALHGQCRRRRERQCRADRRFGQHAHSEPGGDRHAGPGPDARGLR